MILDRLAGLETEYAIRYTPRRGARPGHEVIYDALAEAVGTLVATRPGQRRLVHKQVFTQNGGSLYYEVVPGTGDAGVIEAGTPECRGPSELLLYQRAQDALLTRALPLAERALAERGFDGRLGLLKNCRDADGHIYGAQENYEAEIAAGPALWLYRLGLLALSPLAALSAVATWAVVVIAIAVVLALVPVALALTLLIAIVAAVSPRVGALAERAGEALESEGAERVLLRIFQVIEVAVWWPALMPFLWLLRGVAFRRVRAGAEAFFLSRMVISGAGTLDAAGRLHLSEKAVALRRMVRASALPVERVLFDAGNLLKRLTRLLALQPRQTFGLFRRSQRLQLGLSDSNCAQVAEYLKLGTSTLVVDMAEAGALEGAPRLLAPAAACRAMNADATMGEAVATRAHGPMTALAIQRWYLEAAERFVEEAAVTSLEAREVVRLWRATLDALARDPDELIGRLDWVTKRYLIARAGAGADLAVQKKIDLRYHELGDGYFARLDAAGLVARLVDDEAIARATLEPPERSPAWERGRLVRRLAAAGTRAAVSWESVRVGGLLRGKVIRLSDWRRARAQQEPEV